MRRIVGLVAFLVTVCGLAATLPRPAFADRGRVHPVGVNVLEPAQRAIIAHNGSRQLLILQTDVQADREATVVEFMPLPAKPDVSLAPEGCFTALADLVGKYAMRYLDMTVHRGGSPKERFSPIQVVVEAQLGPHGVTVIEVESADAFVEWVKQFFQEKKLGTPATPEELGDVVAEYCARGIRFFAIDVIEVKAERQTVAPLTYAFESPSIYYPLVVTNLYGGTGLVELFVAVPREFEASLQSVLDALRRSIHPQVREQGMALLRQVQDSLPIAPTDDDLRPLHEDIPQLLGRGRHRLQAFRYRGKLTFAHDLEVPMPDKTAVAASHDFVRSIRSGELEQAADQTSTPYFSRRRRHEDTKAITEELAVARQALEGTWERVHTSCHLPARYWGWIPAQERAFLNAMEKEPGVRWVRAVVVWLREPRTGRLQRWTLFVREGADGVRVAGLQYAFDRLDGVFELDTLQLVADTVQEAMPGPRRGDRTWRDGAEAWARCLRCRLTLEPKGRAHLDVAFNGKRVVLEGLWEPRTGWVHLELTHMDRQPLDAPRTFEQDLMVEQGVGAPEIWTTYRLIEAAGRIWGGISPFSRDDARRRVGAQEGPILYFRRR